MLCGSILVCWLIHPSLGCEFRKHFKLYYIHNLSTIRLLLPFRENIYPTTKSSKLCRETCPIQKYSCNICDSHCWFRVKQGFLLKVTRWLDVAPTRVQVRAATSIPQARLEQGKACSIVLCLLLIGLASKQMMF